MKKELFDELLESVKQGAAIVKGTLKPSRTFKYPESEVRKIRDQYGLSQDKFAVPKNMDYRLYRKTETE